jgi:lipid II:glycine glycyltransferase (peptidoglycan interpeptide bridge formation enzyme)
MITIDISENSDSKWNKRLLESELGVIYQTKEFAAYNEAALNTKPLFIKFLNQNGSIVGQLLISIHPRFMQKSLSSLILKKIYKKSNFIYRWIYGPTIFNSEYSNEIKEVLYTFLIKKKVKVSGTEHPLSSGIFNSLSKPFQLRQWNTFLIDLSHGKTSILERMDKHSTIKNIQRSKNRGVIVKEISLKNLDEYHKILNETKMKVGLTSKLSNLQIQWNKLGPIGFSGFIAYKDDIPVGGLSYSYFNNYINEWGVARSILDRSKNLYSQDLIKWKIIEWGIEKKCHYYDLTGVYLNSTDSKEKGIFQYKKKWGGKLISYNQILI